jgi:nucleoside-diphosphate-sugar epimerase
MRILVLGGTAFIGPPTVHALLEGGHEVALFHRGKTGSDPPDGATEILGDRKDLPDFSKALRDFHADAVLDMFPLSQEDADRVLELFRGHARRVIAVSSMDVYRAYGVLSGSEPGPPEPLPLTEESPVRTVLFPYRGQSERLHDYEKILVEKAYLGDPDLPGTVLRLPMVYGPGDYQHRLFPYLKRMDDGRPAILLSESMAGWRTTRAYVEDVGRAIALAVQSDEARGRTFNVGECEALTETEWIRRIAKEAGWKGELVILPNEDLPAQLRDTMNTEQQLQADTTRIREELGFEESVPSGEAILRTVRWERENPPKGVDSSVFGYEEEDETLRGLAQA